MIRRIRKNLFKKTLSASLVLVILIASLNINVDPHALNIFSPRKAYALATGNKVPTAAAAVTSNAGDNDGFETFTLANAVSSNNVYVTSATTGTVTSSSCALPNTTSDQHDFYTFALGIPAASSISGISVSIEGKFSASAGTNTYCVFLSYDGGTTWTAGKNTADISTTDVTTVLGSTVDTWGRTWTGAEMSDANFRVRVMPLTSNAVTLTASLDNLFVNVSYTPAPPTVASAANQTFGVGQGTTAISTITFTDVSGTSTAANDIRMAIATTSGFAYLWDTTDTTAVIGGTASAKVSTTVSYEGGGSVLVLNVTSALAAGETVTVSDLSYKTFTAVKGVAAGGIQVYVDGVNDRVADASDTKTIAISGSSALGNHVLGQVSSAFTAGQSSITGDLFRFKLTNTGEAASSTVKLNLSSVSGIVTGDVSGLHAYVDYDADGVVDSAAAFASTYSNSDGAVTAMVIDTTNNVMYAGHGTTTGSGDIYRCILSTGCNETGDWTQSYDGAQEKINTIIFDSTAGVLYAGQGASAGDGDILRCIVSSSCDETSDWAVSYDGAASDILSMALDTDARVLYAGFGSSNGNADIYRCDLTTSCDATGDWALGRDGAASGVGSMIYDPTYGTLFWTNGISGSSNGDLYYCDTATGCDDGTKLLHAAIDNSNIDAIWSLAIDTAHGHLYAGLGRSVNEGDIQRCVLSATGCSSSATVYDSSRYNILSLAYDSVHGVMYAGAGTSYSAGEDPTGQGDILVCDTSTDCDATGKWSVDYDGSAEAINALAYDSVNNIVQAGEGNAVARVVSKMLGDPEVFTQTSANASISGASGTLNLLSTTSIAAGALNIIVRGTIANLAANDTMTIALPSSNIVSYGGTSQGLITLSGSATNATHTSGTAQAGTLSLLSPTTSASNEFDISGTSISNKTLYTFRLTPATESISVSNTIFTLSDVRGVSSGDITSADVYIDYNANGLVDGGDTAVASGGTVSISGGNGTISFGTSYTASTSRNYLLRASVASIDNYDELAIRLYATSLTSTGLTSGAAITPTGVISSKVHRKAIASSSGGSPPAGGGTGDSAPPGNGDTGGGSVGTTTTTDTPPPGNGNNGGGGKGGGGEAYVPNTGRRSFMASVWSGVSYLFSFFFN